MKPKKVKIAHVTHLYAPSVGGIQIHIKQLTEKVLSLRDSYEIKVFTSRAMGIWQFNQPELKERTLPKKEVVDGVEVIRCNICYRLYRFIMKQIIKIPGCYRLRQWLFEDAIECFKMGPFVAGLFFSLMKYRPNIILLTNVYNTHAYFCYVYRKLFKVKLIVMPSLRMEPSWLDQLLVEKILLRADRIIAFTEFEKNVIMNKGIEANKIDVIGIGVYPEAFQKADGKRFRKRYGIKNKTTVIGFLNRKAKGKGAEHLVAALPDIIKNNPNTYLVLAGEKRADHDRILLDYIGSLTPELQKRIINIYEFSQEEKPDIYDAFDIFVMPSEIDSFGIVYLEAWSCKKPIIACSHSAPESFVEPSINGDLVEYGNAEDIAQKINKMISDKKRMKLMGENGYKKVCEQFSWDQIADKLIRTYDEVLLNRS